MAVATFFPTPVPWTDQVKGLVRRRYGRIAEEGDFPGGLDKAAEAGYPPAWLAGLPPRVAASYAGCGYPLDGVDLSAVRLAVDLGCGGGLDARLLAERLPPGGRVVALDLAPPMLLRVRQASQGVGGISPLAGDMEELPLASAIADLVLANASFNLTVDLPRAWGEAARILKPGGRLVARELVLDGDLPGEIRDDPAAWNTSLGGVPGEDGLVAAAAAAGLVAISISQRRRFGPVTAVRLTARKGEGG